MSKSKIHDQPPHPRSKAHRDHEPRGARGIHAVSTSLGMRVMKRHECRTPSRRLMERCKPKLINSEICALESLSLGFVWWSLDRIRKKWHRSLLRFHRTVVAIVTLQLIPTFLGMLEFLADRIEFLQISAASFGQNKVTGIAIVGFD